MRTLVVLPLLVLNLTKPFSSSYTVLIRNTKYQKIQKKESQLYLFPPTSATSMYVTHQF